MPNSRPRSILIVEDEPMLAYALEEMVLEAGFLISGVAGRLEEALAIIQSSVCDAAILDTNLHGVSSVPAATALTSGGIPYIVLSGYSRAQQPVGFAAATYLQKPCSPARLIEALRGILNTH